MQKFSELVVSSQRFVVIRDDLGRVSISDELISQLLWEQGDDEFTIKTVPVDSSLNNPEVFEKFIAEVGPEEFKSRDFFDPPFPKIKKPNPRERKWNIVLPPLTDLLCFHRPAVIIEFLYKLRRCAKVKRVFVWISPNHLIYPQTEYLISSCEYLSDVFVHIKSLEELSVIIRRPGGAVISKQYKTVVTDEEFKVEEIAASAEDISTESSASTPSENTFKIELDEEELVARNAMKMPYEKTTETKEGSIIYTPDANDDFDEEDPDDDLCI